MWPWNSPTSWPRPPPSSRSASPPLTSSPWTTQHVSSRHCPPLLGQPLMAMPPTPTTPLSQSPPEHVFGHPTDHHLHWTSRQSTPTFPPQPPFPSQPSPLRMTIHRRLPLPLHKHELWTHASNNPPSTAPSSTRQGLPAGPPQVQSSLYGLPQHAPPPPMTSPTPATCTSQHSPPDTPPPTAT